MSTNGLNKSLPQRGWVKKKSVYGMETYWLFSKLNVLDETVSKEGHADNLLGYQRMHH